MALEKVDKRAVLLDVAEQLFGEYGYEGVSTRMIATEADANVAMIAYYFGSKEKLYEELLNARIPKIGEKLLELKNDDLLNPWEKMAFVIDMYVYEIFARKLRNKMILREMSQSQRPGTVNLIVDNIHKNWSIINAMMKEGQEKGVFKVVDNELTIATLIGTIFNIVNNPLLMMRLVGETDEVYVYSEEMQRRLSVHLKGIFESHLSIS